VVDYLNLAKRQEQKFDDGDNGSKKQDFLNNVYKDEDLVRRAQKDDAWAIEQLIIRYQKKVYKIAYHMLSGDVEEAKDRTQEAFLKAFRNIKQFKGKASFYTWLYRIVANTCFDALKRRQRWFGIFHPGRLWKKDGEKAEFSMEEYPERDEQSDPLSHLKRKQLEMDVQNALKMLSDRQRNIFELKVFHEMSILEIAQLKGIAEGTVKSSLFRATRKIREELGEWVDG
jgi:RNA polymerase sigma-70 factor (ECF subfamily)